MLSEAFALASSNWNYISSQVTFFLSKQIIFRNLFGWLSAALFFFLDFQFFLIQFFS